MGIVPFGQTNRELNTKNILKTTCNYEEQARERERETVTESKMERWRTATKNKNLIYFLLENETKRQRAPSSSPQQI